MFGHRKIMSDIYFHVWSLEIDYYYYCHCSDFYMHFVEKFKFNRHLITFFLLCNIFLLYFLLKCCYGNISLRINELRKLLSIR